MSGLLSHVSMVHGISHGYIVTAMQLSLSTGAIERFLTSALIEGFGVLLAAADPEHQGTRAMLTTEAAVMLANYNNWADQTLFQAVQALPAGVASQSRQTTFGSMIGTLNHNYQVDLIWRAHLLGEKHGFSSRRDVLHPDLDDLAAEQSKVNQWYIDWAGNQTTTSLSERLAFNFVSGQAGEMPRGGIFLHIVNHKTFHRGWVCEMFFNSGHRPPQTDLSVYLTEV